MIKQEPSKEALPHQQIHLLLPLRYTTHQHTGTVTYVHVLTLLLFFQNAYPPSTSEPISTSLSKIIMPLLAQVSYSRVHVHVHVHIHVHVVHVISMHHQDIDPTLLMSYFLSVFSLMHQLMATGVPVDKKQWSPLLS